MHIRIISGKYKGRRISAPKNLPIRPTTDRAKEALFNILQHQVYIPELKILDLFTGSGSIAYEFASRGARHIHAVDRSYPVIKFVKKTAEEFGFSIKTVKKDVLKFLENTPHTYDLIFADPPYDLDKNIQKKLINLIFEKKRLTPDGIFILEHTDKINFEENPYFAEARKYGKSMFSFFKQTNIEQN